MNRKITYLNQEPQGYVAVSGSKSESNRLLILQSFYPSLTLKNVSNSDDTHHLKDALASNQGTIDIGHAGTAMRFLTAYFAAMPNKEVVLTGSLRMQNRPIKILVDALRMLDVDIAYEKKEGYPPLRIKGKKIVKKHVQIQGNVSSQYISALLLIASTLENGLTLELLGEITSVPYINMTLTLLNQIGVETDWTNNLIRVKPKQNLGANTIVVESDWSSASYFYSLVALSKRGSVTLSSYKKDSLQGDSSLVEIYKNLGVNTSFKDNTMTLTKVEGFELPQLLELDLVGSPDLAQTIAVTCFGLGIACDLIGLHTLKVKETDRLVALDNELSKLGANIEVTEKSLHLKAFTGNINEGVSIATYDDHRMAMAFAPLALKVPLIIEDANVVTKSFTTFWEDFENVLA